MLPSSTIPLGVYSCLDQLETSSVPLAGDDQVILLTDGFSETLSPSGEMFGQERTLDILSSNCNCNPEKLLGLLSEEVSSFAKGTEQADDRTGLVLRIV